MTRNHEIIAIACEWIDYLQSNRQSTGLAWKLYDLACGYRPDVEPEVKQWVSGMNQSKPAVKKVLAWLDS